MLTHVHTHGIRQTLGSSVAVGFILKDMGLYRTEVNMIGCALSAQRYSLSARGRRKRS